MTIFIFYVSKTHPHWSVYSSLVWNMHSVPLCDYATINTSILLSKGIWILLSFFFFLCSFGNSAENILDIYVSWSLSMRLPMEYIPCSGVIGSNCFSEWLDPFMFHSLEFLLHSIPSLSSEVFSHFPATSLTSVISAGDHGALPPFPAWAHDPFKAPVKVVRCFCVSLCS